MLRELYNEIKKNHGEIIVFKFGDFYEAFFEDAMVLGDKMGLNPNEGEYPHLTFREVPAGVTVLKEN